MVKSVAIISCALVAVALSAPSSRMKRSNTTEVVESDDGWTESSETIRKLVTSSNSSKAVAINPAECAKGCPCCTPKVDIKASVVESYKRHRAQVAMIGDWGSCSVGNEGYKWEVDWGDDEGYSKNIDPMAPYQAVHTYAKKGKYTIEVSLCSHKEGEEYADCADGCSTVSKKIHVKP